MSNWFASEPDCPIDPPTREWIERRWAWLTEQFGLERVRSSRVILPSADFFPDSYQGTADDARVMLDRVCGYMGIAPETVELSIFEDRNPVHDGQGRLGTAGLYHEEAGKFRIWVEVGNLDDPLGLVATMAHEIGHVLLLGHGRVSPDAEDHEALTDLLTVYLGMGVFTANSVIREHYWHAGAVAGWSMGRRGYLSMPMYGYALARFARTRAEEDPPWAKHLRADVHSAFTKSCRLLAAPAQAVPAPVLAPVTPHPQERQSSEPDDSAPDDGGDSLVSLSAEELLKRYACGERDFRKLDLRGLHLRSANLPQSNLIAVDLSGADLTDAVLSEANLQEADFQEAILCRTNLRRANLSGADFSGADLAGADLSGADIRGADFTGGMLDRTVLVGTLRNASTDLTDVDLSQVVCDVDLSKEDLRGAMLTDRLAAGYDRIARGAGFFLFGSFWLLIGAAIGGLVGTALSVGLGVRTGSLFCISVGGGAILSGVLSVQRIIRLRAQQHDDNRRIRRS
jgi:uncharacterized protein YjbI with pentapeptide repeats